MKKLLWILGIGLVSLIGGLQGQEVQDRDFGYETEESADRAKEDKNYYKLVIKNVDKKKQVIELSDGTTWEYGTNIIPSTPRVGEEVLYDYAFLSSKYCIWMEFIESFGRDRPIWLSKAPKRQKTYQKIITLDKDGKNFELEDGSYWEIPSFTLDPLFPSQTHAKKWDLGDRVSISKKKGSNSIHMILNLDVIKKNATTSVAFAKLKRAPDRQYILD